MFLLDFACCDSGLAIRRPYPINGGADVVIRHVVKVTNDHDGKTWRVLLEDGFGGIEAV